MAADHQSTKVLVLFADTAAGHRRRAEAVIEGNSRLASLALARAGAAAEVADIVAGLARSETLNSRVLR